MAIVKDLMGHSSIVTTQRYLHSHASEKLQAVEALTTKQGIPSPPWQMNDKHSKSDVVNQSFAIS